MENDLNFMKIDNAAIQNMERIYRLNLINSITGIKPANLVGTISAGGQANLAIFSSVIHLGSDPALIGFVTRPAGEVPRHTYENILANGKYTINHVHPSFAEKAHQTSAKFARDVSEFEACGLTEEIIDGFEAPFVRESSLKLGLELVEELPIKQNGTTLVIGRIAIAIIPDEALDGEGHLDLEKADSAGISGLNSYYSVKKIGQYPYARVKT